MTSPFPEEDFHLALARLEPEFRELHLARATAAAQSQAHPRNPTPMSPIINPTELASQLTPVQFETLLRAYLRRVSTHLSPKASSLSLYVLRDREQTLGEVKWTIGNRYASDGVETSGEVLADAAAEHNRRLNWQATAKLQLLEAPQEDLVELPGGEGGGGHSPA